MNTQTSTQTHFYTEYNTCRRNTAKTPSLKHTHTHTHTRMQKCNIWRIQNMPVFQVESPRNTNTHRWNLDSNQGKHSNLLLLENTLTYMYTHTHAHTHIHTRTHTHTLN